MLWGYEIRPTTHPQAFWIVRHGTGFPQDDSPRGDCGDVHGGSSSGIHCLKCSSASDFLRICFSDRKKPSKKLIIAWHMEPWAFTFFRGWFCLTAPTNLKYQNPLQNRISGCLNGFDPLCKSVWTDIFICCSLFSTLISNLSPNLFYVPVLPWWWQHLLI